jgi:hypothetical protein
MQKIHFGEYHSVEIEDQRVVWVIEKQEPQFRAKEEPEATDAPPFR